MKIHCISCGKIVSTEIPDKTVIRAYIQCPECVEKEDEIPNNIQEMEYSLMLSKLFEDDENIVCQRCNKKSDNGLIISIFNTEMICDDCKEKERRHPQYEKAREREYEEIKNGNYNFDGIGLPNDL